jgi:molecular chaperone DnaJ
MNSNRLDPYAVLGVPRHASGAEITHAYRELLRQHHPDTRSAASAGGSHGLDQADVTLARIIAAYSQLREGGAGAGDAPVAGGHRPGRQGVRTGTGDRAPGPDASPIRAGPVRWHRDTTRSLDDPLAYLTWSKREPVYVVATAMPSQLVQIQQPQGRRPPLVCRKRNHVTTNGVMASASRDAATSRPTRRVSTVTM